MGEGGEKRARAREMERERDVSDSLCLLDSPLCLAESPDKEPSLASHTLIMDKWLPPSLYLAVRRQRQMRCRSRGREREKVCIKEKRLSFKASPVRSALIPADSVRRAL